jgi:hypothetical protein
MRNIEIMYADGVIGNKAILLALSTLTTGNINSKLKDASKAYKMKDVLPSTHEYIVPPLSEEELEAQKNRQLFGFMATSPGAPKGFAERVANVSNF